jgi:hypothetical protein
LAKETYKKPRDLRALSQWIEAQKKAASNQDSDADPDQDNAD